MAEVELASQGFEPFACIRHERACHHEDLLGSLLGVEGPNESVELIDREEPCLITVKDLMAAAQLDLVGLLTVRTREHLRIAGDTCTCTRVDESHACSAEVEGERRAYVLDGGGLGTVARLELEAHDECNENGGDEWGEGDEGDAEGFGRLLWRSTASTRVRRGYRRPCMVMEWHGRPWKAEIWEDGTPGR